MATWHETKVRVEQDLREQEPEPVRYVAEPPASFWVMLLVVGITVFVATVYLFGPSAK